MCKIEWKLDYLLSFFLLVDRQAFHVRKIFLGVKLRIYMRDQDNNDLIVPGNNLSIILIINSEGID